MTNARHGLIRMKQALKCKSVTDFLKHFCSIETISGIELIFLIRSYIFLMLVTLMGLQSFLDGKFESYVYAFFYGIATLGPR